MEGATHSKSETNPNLKWQKYKTSRGRMNHERHEKAGKRK